MNTIPLLEAINRSDSGMLSKSELIRRGHSEEVIQEAKRLEQIIIPDEVNYPTLASVMLTHAGYEALGLADRPDMQP